MKEAVRQETASQVNLKTGDPLLDNHRMFWGACAVVTFAGVFAGALIGSPIECAVVGALAVPAITLFASVKKDVNAASPHSGNIMD